MYFFDWKMSKLFTNSFVIINTLITLLPLILCKDHNSDFENLIKHGWMNIG